MSKALLDRRGTDAQSVLTAYVVVLLMIPASMRLTALGSAGSPATILAMGLFLWWLWFHLQRDHPLAGGPQPVRTAMLVWLLVVTVAYVLAMSTPLPFDERSPADSGMLRLMGLAGVLLVANDGLKSLEHARSFVKRLVLAVGLVAALGLFQYATRQLWVDRLSIPGFPRVFETGLGERSGLLRPSGTATHPIEFGVVLTVTLPLAIAYARKAPGRRWLHWGVLGAVSFAVLISISRSAIVCAGVGLAVLFLSWPTATRLKAMLMLLGVLAASFLTIPGLLGTITNLFTRFGADSSIGSRTGSYTLAWEFVERSPFIGRGFGTFLPKYRILDNGYLGVLIETGFLGLAALVALLVIGFASARHCARLAVNDFDREIACALSASIAAGAAALAFFDSFGFPQSAGSLLLVVGLTGGFRRLLLAQAGKETGLGPRGVDSGTAPGVGQRAGGGTAENV